MRILYIHGLDSAPNADRMGWLEQQGHQVYALHLDYRMQPNAFDILAKELEQRQADYLVGSSLGGYLAYWLGERYGLPVLIYNPAMHLSIEGLGLPEIQELRCPRRHIVLGAQDERVDPQWNWQWLQKQERPGLAQRIIMCHWLGHQIDPETFASTARWAGLGG